MAGVFQRERTRTEYHVDDREENANAGVNDNRALFLAFREINVKEEGRHGTPPYASTRLLEPLRCCAIFA